MSARISTLRTSLTLILIAALALTGCRGPAPNVRLQVPEFMTRTAVNPGERISDENSSGIVNGYRWQTDSSQLRDIEDQIEKYKRQGAYGELRATQVPPGTNLDKYLNGFQDIKGVIQRTAQQSPLTGVKKLNEESIQMGGEPATLVIYEGVHQDSKKTAQQAIDRGMVSEGVAEDIYTRRIYQVNTLRAGYGWTLTFICSRAMFDEWREDFRQTVDSLQFVPR